jgi:hypothetical protein
MNEMTCCPLTSSDDGESPTFYESTKPVARRIHTCSECSGKITKGERYERVGAMWPWNKRPETYLTCALCVEIRTHFACNGWIFGQLWEDLENNFFQDMKAGGICMQGLSPAAKQKLIDARMEWYFAQDEVDDSAWDGWETRRPQP